MFHLPLKAYFNQYCQEIKSTEHVFIRIILNKTLTLDNVNHTYSVIFHASLL